MLEKNLVETYVVNGDCVEPLWSSLNLNYYFKLFKENEIKISGGDVYRVVNGETVPTGDNWSISQKNIDNGKSYALSERFVLRYEKHNTGRFYYAFSLRDEMNLPIYLSKEHPVAYVDGVKISNILQITISDCDKVIIRAMTSDLSELLIKFRKVCDLQMMSIENCYSRLFDSSNARPNSDLLFIQESNRIREIIGKGKTTENNNLKEYCILEKGENVVFVISPETMAIEHIDIEKNI